MKNWLCLCLSVLFLNLSYPAFAEDDAFWEEMAKRPDVKITTENGKKIAHFSSGVSVTDPNGSGQDQSGKGAVLCGWLFYVEVKNMSEVCSPAEDSEVTKNLDYAIEKISDFIVANSLKSVIKAGLEEDIKTRFLSTKEDFSIYSGEDLEEECSASYAVQVKKSLLSKSSEEFKKSIDDFLSIPRPPVMEPCL